MPNGAQAMLHEDLAYWKQRAEQQLELAAIADHPNARKAHQVLADYYLERANRLRAGANLSSWCVERKVAANG